eukprot:15442214-Alexandrium_andersonii.AAC.1
MTPDDHGASDLSMSELPDDESLFGDSLQKSSSATLRETLAGASTLRLSNSSIPGAQWGLDGGSPLLGSRAQGAAA